MSGPSLEDKKALTKMEETVTMEDGHYMIGLPWRTPKPDLPNNRTMAEGRMRLLRKRLMKDEAMREKYANVVNGYIEKGYAQKIIHESAMDVPKWYLPHHGVVNPKKPEKLRVVFDCAAKYKGRSLNEELLQGPDLNNTLVGVLLRFRQDKIAIVADIEAMFHQVKVEPKDCSALRFLWWNENLDQEPEDYQMLVHLFGATSSPSVCRFALERTAEEHGKSYDSETVNTIKENFYVDDCLKSVDSEKNAIELIKQLTSLLKQGGFHLTKWISNSSEVMHTIPNTERAKSIIDLDLEKDTLPVERALGVLWDVEKDAFTFGSVLNKKPTTRRGLLSVTSSLYDPMGFVAPVVLTAKKLLQKLCKLGWDEEIPEEVKTEWIQWLTDLQYLSNISISRCFTPSGFRTCKKMALMKKYHGIPW